MSSLASGGLGERCTASAASLAVALLLLAPRLASACSVCSAGRDEQTRTAFILTTIFLSCLPVAIVGGVSYWLVRRARALEAQGPTREAERLPQPGAGDPLQV